MFTVLIAEKKHIDAIKEENKLFFEPFLENKELAFCYWNPKGQSLYDSVPELLDAVGRRKEWRAVIINNTTDDVIDHQNPFDVVDFSELSELIPPTSEPISEESLVSLEKEWLDYYEKLKVSKEKIYREALDFPLQKLSTWLCFKPEDYILGEVAEKQDIQDWALEKIGGDDLKLNVKLEIIERNHYKNEIRMKEIIRREFVEDNYLNIAYPKEVHCISIRTSEKGFFNPENFWNVRQENEYSAFTDRNMYFDKMRFMVFDLLSEKHRNFRNDYIRFLATVLIFITNQVPGSAMQARRLYQLEVETDETPLCTLVTSYDKKLLLTSEVIDNEIEKIRSEIPSELTDKTAEALFCTPKDVEVLLDESCDTDAVFVKKDYGLFGDLPQDEHNKWSNDYQESEKALTYIVKHQSRSIRKSIDKLQLNCDVAEADISRLTSFQLDDVKYFTKDVENEMVSSIPPSISDMSKYKERMEQEANEVKKVIKQRMTFKTTIILSIICLGLYLLCFLPFIFSNNATNKTISTSINLIFCMIGLLALILFVTLLIFRKMLTNRIREYNDQMHEIMTSIHESLRKISKYLSANCNVRRGYKVISYSEKNMDDYSKSIRIRKKHQEDIRRRRAYLEEEYKDFFGDKTYCDETMIIPYEYDFDQQVEYDYPAPFLAGDYRQIDFMSGGNKVDVPSSYIKNILVRMEGIYDK